MPTQLDRIMSQTSLTVDLRKGSADLRLLERNAAAHQPRGFETALRASAAQGPAIIAELKKASPSKGLLREDYQPVTIARGYESAGAAAISVLTDELFFQGSLSDLAAVCQQVSVPVLRKDFILDPFQILEARASGADAILLIVAAHEDATLREFKQHAEQMGLDVLCEVHNRSELDRAIDLGCTVIGVNSRDLKTLEVHPAVHADLVQFMPPGVLRVAESGIRTRENVVQLSEAGWDAFLVGEALMREPDPAAALATLRGIVSG